MRARITRGTAVVMCVTNRPVRSAASHCRRAAASRSRTTARSSSCQARFRCATWPLAYPELGNMAVHHGQSAAGHACADLAPGNCRVGVPVSRSVISHGIHSRAPSRRYLEPESGRLSCKGRGCFVCILLRGGRIIWTVSPPSSFAVMRRLRARLPALAGFAGGWGVHWNPRKFGRRSWCGAAG